MPSIHTERMIAKHVKDDGKVTAARIQEITRAGNTSE